MEERQDRRVVLCTPGFPTSSVDPDKPFLLDHAKALIDADLKVTVVSPAVAGSPSYQVIDGVEVRRVRYAPQRMETLAATGSMYSEARGLKALLVFPMVVSLAFCVAKELRREPSIAYGHWWIPGGLVAVIVGRLMRCPSVVHLHGSDAFVAKRGIMKRLARFVLRLANERLAASEALASWGCEISSTDVRVLPMPVVVELSADPSPAPDDGYVLGVGRLVPEKGFDILLEAVACLEPDERPEVVVVGVGPERKALLEKATKAGVELHLPGAVAPKELAEWYRGARIVVVPSRREGFGLVAAEAAAASRAVVGSSVGALPTIVQPGVSGLLVMPGDVAGLARAIKDVDPAWGENGPRLVSHLGPSSHGHFVRQLCDDLSQ